MVLILFNRAITACTLKYLPYFGSKRFTSHCHSMKMIGSREVVGYGWNGCPSYADMVDYPFPSIRFQELNAEVCEALEKEKGDWTKLSIEEKKQLYRFSFCQTFTEFKAPTGDWKLALGSAFIIIAIGILITHSYSYWLYGPLPVSFDDDHRKSQLQRIIALNMNPIDGISSKWDYKRNNWK